VSTNKFRIVFLMEPFSEAFFRFDNVQHPTYKVLNELGRAMMHLRVLLV